MLTSTTEESQPSLAGNALALLPKEVGLFCKDHFVKGGQHRHGKQWEMRFKGANPRKEVAQT